MMQAVLWLSIQGCTFLAGAQQQEAACRKDPGRREAHQCRADKSQAEADHAGGAAHALLGARHAASLGTLQPERLDLTRISRELKRLVTLLSGTNVPCQEQNTEKYEVLRDRTT